jgi:hypothetical protein
LNHYLKPLIDDAEVSWKKGVRYNRTALHPNGRIVRSAIVCEVCDLPGARKLAGLASSISHHFCSLCTVSGLKNLGRHDHEKWKTRDVEELRDYAEQWRDASTKQDRDNIFKKHGVRWSELWRLPYWNPVRQLTVDSMHCILEDLVSFHFRDVLKLTVKSATANAAVTSAFTHIFRQPLPQGHPDREDQPSHKQLSVPEIQHVAQIHALLTSTVGGEGNAGDDAEAIEQDLEWLAAKLVTKNKKPLMFVCDDLGLQPLTKKPTKRCYADCLVQWVRITILLIPCN